MPIIELPDGRVVDIAEADMPAFEQAMAAEFQGAPETPQEAPQEAQESLNPGADFLQGLAGTEGQQVEPAGIGGFSLDEPVVDAPESPGDVFRGLAFEVGRLERGIKQLATDDPAEKKALAIAEEKARSEFAEVDEGIGLEDAGELAFVLGSLAIPGGAPVQTAARGAKIASFMKSLPTNWGGAAILAGLKEFVSGKTADESPGGEALKAATIVGAGGAVGSKIAGLVINPWTTTGASKGLAATLGATVGARDSKRIFREGIFRRFARALTGKVKDPRTDPVPRALLRRGGQEDSRLVRDAAKAEAAVAAKSGVDAGDINGFLDTFPAIIKGIRPLKAAKEAGKTTADVRDEARTMFALLQNGVIRTSDDGSAVIDVGLLRGNFDELASNPKFSEVFSKPKQKQLEELVDSYSRAALTQGKDQAGISGIFQKAQDHIQGERVQGLEDVETYLRNMTGKTPSSKYGLTTAMATWMAQNELDPAAMAQHFTSEGWLGQLELFETIAEQVE